MKESKNDFWRRNLKEELEHDLVLLNQNLVSEVATRLKRTSIILDSANMGMPTSQILKRDYGQGEK